MTIPGLEFARHIEAAREMIAETRAGLSAQADGTHRAVAVPAESAVLNGRVMSPGRRSPASLVDGGTVLGLTSRWLSRYVAFPNKASLIVVTAWAAHAIARERDDTGIGQLIWRVSPRLLVTSRKRGSGKSTLLDAIVILSRAEGKVPKMTARAFAETVGETFDVAVLDEAKTIFGSGSKSLELQGALLAGYTPRTIYRVKGKRIPLFGAVAYAGKDELITSMGSGQIGDLLDRSITIRLQPPRNVMPELDEQAEEEGDLLASALIAWTDATRADLRQAARDMAGEDREAGEAGNLRTLQICRPLRAIGRVADGWRDGDDRLDEPGPWETAVLSSVAELTAGAAGSEAADAITELQRRAAAWGPDGDDEPGVIETEPGLDDE